jgi:hypothetical protein
LDHLPAHGVERDVAVAEITDKKKDAATREVIFLACISLLGKK